MPSTELRQNVLQNARRIVVKLGTQLLTIDEAGVTGVNLPYLHAVAKQIADLIAQGREVTLVSSGAIGAGCAELGLQQRPRDVASQQAVAAIGQRRLMTHWHEAFAEHGLGVGQVLVTRKDFEDRDRFLNIRNCIARLQELGAVAILNENDTVAIEELRFGDNDLLAALTCHALRADALFLLTVVDGLLNESGEVVDLVNDVQTHLGLARRSRSRWGSGGMLSKLEAARLVTDAGEITVIASGQQPEVLPRLLAGEKLGTVFMPARPKLDSRRRWFGLTVRPSGTVTINDGATSALRNKGSSLLAVGITNLTGQFQRGEVLLVRDETGKEVARGLTNYDSRELRRIMGKRSSEFEELLQHASHDTVIHRDNLLLTR